MTSCTPTQKLRSVSPAGPVQARHEVTEHDADEYQRQQLHLKGRLEDVRRHRPLDHLHEVAGTAPFHPVHHLRCIRQRRRQRPGRLRLARGDEIDQHQAGQDRHQSRDQVEAERLAPYAAEGPLARHVADTDDDRRQDQRHHDHLQGVEEEAAEKVEDRQQGGAEHHRRLFRQPAGHGGQGQRDCNLPVQGQIDDSGKHARCAHSGPSHGKTGGMSMMVDVSGRHNVPPAAVPCGRATAAQALQRFPGFIIATARTLGINSAPRPSQAAS